MARTRRIGILTGGGDVPGLNSVIKSVTYRATELGYEVLGIRRGWEGLTHQRPGAEPDPSYVVPSTASPRGPSTGPAARCSTPRARTRARCAPTACPPHLDAARAATMTTDGELYDLTPVVLENIERLGLDYLVPIGGDDTLSFAQTLHDHGVPLIAIPKTMDNDVQGTEYCIGFSTAITRAKEAINRQRTTLGSHERIGVFRIFGRDCGLHRALHRLRHLGALPHPGGALRPRPADPAAGRGPRQQPQPLRLRHRRRGRHLVGRHASRRWARRTPSATATRPTSPRSWRPRSRSGPASRPSSRS